MKILINAINLKIGGGRGILINYLELLNSSMDRKNNTYFVLVPDYNEYKKFENSNLKILEIKNLYKKSILFPFVNYFILPKYIKKYNPDVIFSMGNIAIPTNIPQVLLLHWAYAVYPESKVWDMMDIKSKLSRKLRLFLFSNNLQYANKVIVQTATMKKRLEKFYNFKNIDVIPNAVSLENLNSNTNKEYDFKLPLGIKLLYLTHYYTHKNLEILIPLAKIIKERKLDYKIIITIDNKESIKANKFLEQIDIFNLKDVIYNIGTVDSKQVASLYKQCDGLLMPTLLESYGLPYLEAMSHNLTILTSDLDFAKDVCGNAAYYFDPLDELSILKSINYAFTDDKEKNRKIENGKSKIENLLTWNNVIHLYEKTFKEVLVP